MDDVFFPQKSLTVYFFICPFFFLIFLIVDKELVVQMGLLEPILDLLESEDPTVQCNSCACMMTLAVSGECSLCLYLLLEFIQLFHDILRWNNLFAIGLGVIRRSKFWYSHIMNSTSWHSRYFSQCFWPLCSSDYKPFSDFHPKCIHDQLILINVYIGFCFRSSVSLMSMLMSFLHFTRLRKARSFNTPLVSDTLQSSSESFRV